ELDAGVLRRDRELSELRDLLVGIRVAPTRAVEAVVLRRVHVRVHAVAPAERDHVQALLVRPRLAVEAFHDPADAEAHPSRQCRPWASTIAPSCCRRGTECARRSSVGSSAASVAVQTARPASIPDAPPRQAASTAAGYRAGSTPCESTTHGNGTPAPVSRDQL